MQPTARFSRGHAARPASQTLRLQPVIDLRTGTPVGLVAEPHRPFEDRVRFGPATGPGQANLPGSLNDSPLPGDALGSLAGLIETAASLSQSHAATARPIHVPVPAAALLQDGLARTCAAAAARMALCPQEICLDIADSAFSHRRHDMFAIVRDLRATGLLVGIDARRTWDAPLGEGLRLLVDRVAIRLHALERSADLEARVAEADASGMAVMVEGARRRDGDWLAGMGVSLAVNPRLDS